MKSEKEKKSKSVPTKMTQDQYKVIKQKARNRSMSVSAFMVEAAVHGDKHITPLHVMRLQNRFNEAADVCEEVNPQLAAELRREGDALWQLLSR